MDEAGEMKKRGGRGGRLRENRKGGGSTGGRRAREGERGDMQGKKDNWVELRKEQKDRMMGTSGKMIHISPGTQVPDAHHFLNTEPIPGSFT